ncbi:50S ribosomal protein L11 methyltransferase [Altibacter sp. HG106]|uniref:50S ribosomal protein L11 methyltransferase n=1 Tax=Altibacter sp. HG106 TaxID=3023937 RepID=UPI0023502D50|nr:50S ribosomal protein L11 methyltransferase [Altibacter sp. HG106]MDC7995818.1 50S ribosomal protein L11 methyltransferase [Altibacter sp. HG106]
MTPIYLEYHFTVEPTQPGTDILIAQLGVLGFESFVETDTGVQAYVQKEAIDPHLVKKLQVFESDIAAISFTFREIEQVNWNSEWERNFHPIEVGDQCRVRAPFHESKKVPYEIIIEPKMSFGTGHHETTFMMLEYILENDWNVKKVLDMGCGTAVLGILASMRGAKEVSAIDIDSWCVENSLENATRNQCDLSVSLGDASVLPNSPTYDVVIANINRNILLEDLPKYKQSLRSPGELYLSGFYAEDLPILQSACNKLGFQFVGNKEKNQWIAAKFVL